MLRRLLDCTQEIAAACLAPVENVAEFLDHAEHKIFQVAEAKVRPGFSPLSALVDNEIATLEAIWGRKDGSLTGVTSGFTDLDNYTAGFQASDLIILAARPSMGKTALALNIAFNAAYGRRRAGQSIPPVPVAFFSLEMSKEQLVRRLLSGEGRVDASQIRRAAFLTGEEWTKLQEAAGILLDCPIYIDDTPAATVLDIRAKSRRLKADGKLGLIVIDYLQLMQGRAELSSREQQISEISRSLKGLAKELAVPVIALSQLSREPEKRERKRPQLSDLRESGAIEQDADVVMFIYRDEVYRKDSPDNQGIAEVIVGKQRNGPIGTVKLHFEAKFTRFDDLDKRRRRRVLLRKQGWPGVKTLNHPLMKPPEPHAFQAGQEGAPSVFLYAPGLFRCAARSADFHFNLPGLGLFHFGHHQPQHPVLHGRLDLALIDEAAQVEVPLVVAGEVFLIHHGFPRPQRRADFAVNGEMVLLEIQGHFITGNPGHIGHQDQGFGSLEYIHRGHKDPAGPDPFSLGRGLFFDLGLQFLFSHQWTSFSRPSLRFCGV